MLAHNGVGAFARAKDIVWLRSFETLDCRRRDHAPIGDNADPADGEASPQTVYRREQCVTSAVVPGHISVQVSRPAPSTISAKSICLRSG